jgi:hypothetical protein
MLSATVSSNISKARDINLIMGIVFFVERCARDRYEQIIYIFSAMFILFRKHWEVYGTIGNITVVQGV